MFTVTLIDSTVFVEKDNVLVKRLYSSKRHQALAIYVMIAEYFDVQGLLANDSGIIN